MHVLPQVRRLDERFRDELVVVGVHSGKFEAERVTENIRQAVLRLEVDHPVVNDRFFRTWRAYTVSAWPTLVLVDPEGRYIAAQPGEITYESFEPVVRRLIEEFDRQGLVDRRVLQLRPERESEPDRLLSFPGKVLVDGPNRLFVSDSNHNRILLVELGDGEASGHIRMIIGSGRAGMVDGGLQNASFHRPQGLALHGDMLYVADSENHAVRVVDLKRREVSTLAGTGRESLFRGVRGPGRETDLSSPWDVAVRDGTLYIAMAGVHQIWRLDLAGGEVQPFAGSGREGIVDGPLAQAELAQTMGLALGRDRLYFAEAESSGVRWADTAPGGEVHTIAGTGLFEFGDRDGTGDDALLQHCQGIAEHQGTLYVADTYNNKIRVVDPGTRRVATFLGTGEAGAEDGREASFDEPGGVCAGNGLLYIADTNNHAVRLADLQTKEVRTLKIAEEAG